MLFACFRIFYVHVQVSKLIFLGCSEAELIFLGCLKISWTDRPYAYVMSAPPPGNDLNTFNVDKIKC